MWTDIKIILVKKKQKAYWILSDLYVLTSIRQLFMKLKFFLQKP